MFEERSQSIQTSVLTGVFVCLFVCLWFFLFLCEVLHKKSKSKSYPVFRHWLQNQRVCVRGGKRAEWWCEECVRGECVCGYSKDRPTRALSRATSKFGTSLTHLCSRRNCFNKRSISFCDFFLAYKVDCTGEGSEGRALKQTFQSCPHISRHSVEERR
jgi:hypothetical protein